MVADRCTCSEDYAMVIMNACEEADNKRERERVMPMNPNIGTNSNIFSAERCREMVHDCLCLCVIRKLPAPEMLFTAAEAGSRCIRFMCLYDFFYKTMI